MRKPFWFVGIILSILAAQGFSPVKQSNTQNITILDRENQAVTSISDGNTSCTTNLASSLGWYWEAQGGWFESHAASQTFHNRMENATLREMNPLMGQTVFCDVEEIVCDSLY